MKVLEQSLVIIISIVLYANAIKFQKKVRSLPVFRAFPCGDESIVSVFQEGLASGYNVTINKDLGPATDIKLKFDSPAAVFLVSNTTLGNLTLVQQVYKIKYTKI